MVFEMNLNPEPFEKISSGKRLLNCAYMIENEVL